VWRYAEYSPVPYWYYRVPLEVNPNQGNRHYRFSHPYYRPRRLWTNFWPKAHLPLGPILPISWFDYIKDHTPYVKPRHDVMIELVLPLSPKRIM
jgi:hypothetical protein